MTEGDRDNSGELSSFLHLTGWRPLVLALIAGLAGAVGLFGALNAPAEFQARYVLNAQRVADDDFTPAQLDIFVEEIAQTAKFPQVELAVEDRTGLVNEEDYEITVNQSGSSLSLVDINVVAGDPVDAQTVAIETGIEALTITLNKVLGGHVAGANQISDSIIEVEATIDDLTEQAGFLNPSTAYDLKSQEVIQRRRDIANPPTRQETDADGNVTEVEIPYNGPSLEQLLAELNVLQPLDRAYKNEIAELDALNLRLADRNSDIRDANAALALVEIERESPLVISEVVTEETSRIAGLLTGLLLFAVPAALLVIFAFVIFDLLRKKPAEPTLRRAEDFTAAGVLEAQAQRALPEASVTPLVVVDEEELAVSDSDVLNEEDEDEPDEDEPNGDDPKAKKRSKDGRWGRDASSKAG